MQKDLLLFLFGSLVNDTQLKVFLSVPCEERPFVCMEWHWVQCRPSLRFLHAAVLGSRGAACRSEAVSAG